MPDPAELIHSYREVRGLTELLCEPLSPEDCAAQSMYLTSPVKWHLAHTTWFFETFALEPALAGYRVFDPAYRVLFNSYYNGVGEQFSRPQRGLLTRPALAEVMEYRGYVDKRVLGCLEAQDGPHAALTDVIEVGLQHEQQHQELILTDVKHLFSRNVLRPAYHGRRARPGGEAAPLRWHEYEAGLCEIGVSAGDFAFDNEQPRHRVYLEPYALASRCVTNGEFLEFMADGGYERSELWLSDGWGRVETERWRAPLYWERQDDGWTHLTLAGSEVPRDADPLCHVSYYEADAYARWAGARLPSEAEWECAAAPLPIRGNFLESEQLHPRPAREDADTPQQLFGDVWEWTASAYAPYPGFRPASGALGEYNGKFMSNQMVLRGGSCATPAAHARASYRNFFPPDARWQFCGLRLARDV